MSTSPVKHAYQQQSVARSYDRERFSGLVGRLFDGLEKRAIRALVRKLLREIPEPKVLDCPCGTGRITQLLLSLGLRVTAGDISSAMLEVAAEKCAPFGDRVAFRRLDLDGLALPDGSFHVVSCIRLFHHLQSQDRERILKELARVSSRFVLVNVAYSSRYYAWRRRFKRLLGQGISKCCSSWPDITREASAAGLRVKACRFALRGFSEDLILLFEKTLPGQ